MDTNVLVGLLRLDLECRGFAETTIGEYTRIAGMFLDEHNGVVEGFTRENVVGWISVAETSPCGVLATWPQEKSFYPLQSRIVHPQAVRPTPARCLA